MEYQYPYNQQVSSSGKIIGVSLIFFIFGSLLTFLICYLIYDTVLKNKQVPSQIIQPKLETITETTPIIKLKESDLNIDDSVDDKCIQKRRFFDSDFDRTIYPINDNEIIYF